MPGKTVCARASPPPRRSRRVAWPPRPCRSGVGEDDDFGAGGESRPVGHATRNVLVVIEDCDSSHMELLVVEWGDPPQTPPAVLALLPAVLALLPAVFARCRQSSRSCLRSSRSSLRLSPDVVAPAVLARELVQMGLQALVETLVDGGE